MPSGSRQAPIWAGVALALALPIAFVLLVVGAMSGAAATNSCGADVRVPATDFQGGKDAPGEGVPPRNFIPAYFAAADQPDAKLGVELGPFVLMAIHEIESNFGRSNKPGVKKGINQVGDVSCCKGPFQFYDLSRSTWSAKSPLSGRTYARDGDGDGDIDIYSNLDAMFAAAAYLHASGAPEDWRTAIFAYNHADWYVDKVLRRARDFQALLAGHVLQQSLPAASDSPPGSPLRVGATRSTEVLGEAGFEELGYAPGTNESNARTGRLGNLPRGTQLRVTYRGKTVEAVKLDVGKGGGAIRGKPPAIALSRRLADKLGLRGDDVVSVQRLDGGALPQAQPDAGQNAPGAPDCAAPEGVEQVVNASDGGPYQSPLAAGSYTVTGVFWEQREGYNHEGTDLAASTGTPIFAVGAGRVIVAGTVGGYGKYSCIQHTQTLTSCYAHQSRIAVAVGDTVQRGQRIGDVGNTGGSTGPHLHFEMRAGANAEAPPHCPATYVRVPSADWCAQGSPGFGA